jgi:hypothetical protein
MEVETFRAVARRYGPDLVVVGYIPNDDQVPVFMKQSALRWPSTLYLYNLLVHGAATMRNRAREMMPARADYLGARNTAWGNVPEQYRDMEGPDVVRRAYTELAAMTRPLGIPVLVMGHYHVHLGPAQAADLRARDRFVFVAEDPLYAAYERRHAVKVVPDDTLLSRDDPHPNVLGHRILAEGIYHALIDGGLVPPARPGGAR